MFLTALAHMNLKSSVHVCLGAQAHPCIQETVRGGEQSGQTWPTLSMGLNTRAHTRVRDFTVRRTGKTKYFPSMKTLTHSAAGSQSPNVSQSLPFSHNHFTEMWFQPFHRKSGQIGKV